MAAGPDLEPLLLCPRCRAALSLQRDKAQDRAYFCTNANCVYHTESFPMVEGTLPSSTSQTRSSAARLSSSAGVFQ